MVNVSRHPLLAHKLTLLRDKNTDVPSFRSLVRDLTRLLFYEVMADAPLEAAPCCTPMAEFAGQRLAWRIGLMPILRAGLGMADALVELLPTATVHHLGLYRDHATLQPVTYYQKLPTELPLDLSLILDPMLATGGSAIAAVDLLKKAGGRRIRFLGLIAAPEGVAAMQAAHPDVPLHLGVIDSHLNEVGYIVPGLGDAGDRQYGTA